MGPKRTAGLPISRWRYRERGPPTSGWSRSRMRLTPSWVKKTGRRNPVSAGTRRPFSLRFAEASFFYPLTSPNPVPHGTGADQGLFRIAPGCAFGPLCLRETALQQILHASAHAETEQGGEACPQLLCGFKLARHSYRDIAEKLSFADATNILRSGCPANVL